MPLLSLYLLTKSDDGRDSLTLPNNTITEEKNDPITIDRFLVRIR